MTSICIQFLLMLLPWRLRRPALQAFFGYEIDPTARIGFSIISVGKLHMGPGACIGHLTRVKGLQELSIGEAALLGNLNWVTAFPLGHETHFAADLNRNPSLIINRHAAITHRHLIDCTDRVIVGEFTTVAGWRSQILTHAIDVRLSRQSAAPITIGKFCFVGTGAIVLKGASLPDYSILSAGSVLTGTMSDTYTLYSGVPAVAVKTLDRESAYFQRVQGFVY
jgi:acetyltransferase-like isoleucine patch superfamily enzyme